MLKLKNVTKIYPSGESDVKALKGVSMNFRRSEFVSVLGPSGCGKTTLLNIVGGLDRYTEGDLVINGVSTKDYKDGDWDTYRNHSVGFVFQSYNLIPHQTVIKNVELALTLSGIGKEERRQRAKDALVKVGLFDQLNKKPNQLSGGQMQRVAIARAIVNDPEIILADEPTGALDSETSVQIMDILKELSKTRLVVMVTHNGDLANEYSTRIISLSDGLVVGDTNPYSEEEEAREEGGEKAEQTEEKKKTKKQKKPSMSFLTALSLSMNNLLTKKARTILTAFAGSIGIIGIALILSLSAGFDSYIKDVQRDTLSNYPITIEKVSTDYSSILTSLSGTSKSDLPEYPDTKEVTSQPLLEELLNSVNSLISTNDLKSFKKHLDNNFDPKLFSAIRYSYDLNTTTFFESGSGDDLSIRSVAPVVMPDFNEVAGEAFMSLASYYAMFERYIAGRALISEIVDNKMLLDRQYDVLAGHWPENANEAVVVIDERNQLTDITMYMLGLMDDNDIIYAFRKLFIKMMNEKEVENGVERDGEKVKLLTEEELDAETFKQLGFTRSKMNYTFDELLGLKYRVVLNSEKYSETETVQKNGKDFGLWGKMSDDDFSDYVKDGNYVPLEIAGIVRIKEAATSGSLNTALCYSKAFTELLIARNNNLEIIKQVQKIRDGEYGEAEFFNLTDGSVIANGIQFDKHVSDMRLSVIDVESPEAIYVYPISFEAKDAFATFVDDYNKSVDEEQQIKYTDYVGLLMDSVTIIVNAITYVLIAFVSISLVVSSIMIAVITHISVLERTKEIGVLRSIGASKRDISRVFNAETFIIGLVAGVMGILITLILIIPINIIIYSLAGLVNIAALPVVGAFSLIAISVVLTVIAGLIPAAAAAKKDPVVALRTE